MEHLTVRDRLEFYGSIINGKKITNSISVLVFDYGILLDDANKDMFSKKTLTLFPFSIKMLRSINVSEMKEGIKFKFQGTKLGSYSEGPKGHPGDGEFDLRKIEEWSLSVSYTPTQLNVLIKGKTFKGSSSCAGKSIPESNETLPSWEFEVEFTAPRSKLKSFLEMNDGEYTSFEECLDLCG